MAWLATGEPLLSCRRNWGSLLRLRRHGLSPRLYITDTAIRRDRASLPAMMKAGWSAQSFVLCPACRAGAHVCVGIAGPHFQSRAIAASFEAASPARYRALRIRFDPPGSSATGAELVSACRRQRVVGSPSMRTCSTIRPSLPAPARCRPPARRFVRQPPRSGSSIHRSTCGA